MTQARHQVAAPIDPDDLRVPHPLHQRHSPVEACARRRCGYVPGGHPARPIGRAPAAGRSTSNPRGQDGIRPRRPQGPRPQHARRPAEHWSLASRGTGDEQVGRPGVHLVRRADAAGSPVTHDRDAGGECHCLDLVVRDVDHGRAEAPVQQLELAPQFGAQARRRGSTAVHRAETPGPRAPAPARWRPAGAGRRTAAQACARAASRGAACSAARRTRAAISASARRARADRTTDFRRPSSSGTARRTGTPCRYCGRRVGAGDVFAADRRWRRR